MRGRTGGTARRVRRTSRPAHQRSPKPVTACLLIRHPRRLWPRARASDAWSCHRDAAIRDPPLSAPRGTLVTPGGARHLGKLREFASRPAGTRPAPAPGGAALGVACPERGAPVVSWREVSPVTSVTRPVALTALGVAATIKLLGQLCLLGPAPVPEAAATAAALSQIVALAGLFLAG